MVSKCDVRGKLKQARADDGDSCKSGIDFAPLSGDVVPLSLVLKRWRGGRGGLGGVEGVDDSDLKISESIPWRGLSDSIADADEAMLSIRDVFNMLFIGFLS